MKADEANEIPQEESYNSVDDMFKKFDEQDLRWKKKHPIRGYIRDSLDKIFPEGLADGYRAYYILQKPWKILHYYKKEIEYAYQRVFRGWDDKAVWSLDHYLAKIIPQILKKLKEDKEGTPMEFFNGLPYEDENTYSYSEESIKIADERWNAVLDEMILGFERYNKLWETSSYEEEREGYKKVERALELLKLHFENLWD